MTAAMKPLRFVLICDTYPPVVGGSEVEAQRVCAAMKKRGHQVQVWTSGGPPMPPLRDWVDPEGVPVRILTRNSRGRNKDLAFAAEVAWNLWAHRAEYDIVYFLMQGLHLAAGLPVARALGKPMVMKFGGSGVVPLMRASRAGRVELEWLKKWASRLLVLNQGMVEEAVADGFARDKLYWMPNPTDTELFAPLGGAAQKAQLRERLGLPVGARVVLYVGRLAPEKGLHWLVEAFGKLARRDAGAVLVLCGDGPQRGALEAQVAGLGPDAGRVVFAGSRPVREIASWAQASDAFALTSPSEGFSCALAEAMSAGLPAVVSDIPANTQLIEQGVSGLLVPVGDTDAIAGALGDLLGQEDLRERLGGAARRRIVENFSLGQVVALYERLFGELLAAGPR